MAVNILECFNHDLPVYEHVDRTEVQAGPSSETTKKQLPPRLLIAKDVYMYLALAEAFLKSKAATTNQTLLTNYCPGYESCGLETEQDVVHLSTLYLIHPVILAINAKYPQILTQLSECKLDALRVDLNIKTKTQGKNEAVMMVEYKRCGYIQEKQFEEAMCSADEAKEMDELLKSQGKQFSLKAGSNALWFTKQAMAYHQRTHCKYVALCDYEHLILLKFDNLLESAKVTIVPRKNLRKALLGFLLEACTDAKLV